VNAPAYVIELGPRGLAAVRERADGDLRQALAALDAPVTTLDLQRGDREGRGWVDDRWAAIEVPGRFVAVPTDFLPVALARLFALGPRPRMERAERLRRRAGELAAMLARGEAAGDSEAARTLAQTLREHWRVEARWAPAPGSPGVRMVEAIDTAAGVWLVIPDDPEVELWPVTPTVLWRRLTALLPRSEELGELRP
jgi:hypothetical protein